MRRTGMRKRRADFDLNATQDLHAEGRLEYAHRLFGEAGVALKGKDLEGAIRKLKVSARAFPSPVTLVEIGECLLRQGKPADAILYLAAAVGMSVPGKHARPLLLLVEALLRAREKSHALLRCQELAAMFPDMKEALSANPEEAVEELLRRVGQQIPPPAG
jgi:tetratricopeptide (TPR) repeat protein